MKHLPRPDPGRGAEDPERLGRVPTTMLADVLRFDTPPARLRAVVFLEGISYLLLLFVAMPLKYFGDLPLAVRVAGSVHGFLFVTLVVLTLRAMRSRGKSFAWGSRIAVASVVPFATFALDRDLGADDRAYRGETARR